MKKVTFTLLPNPFKTSFCRLGRTHKGCVRRNLTNFKNSNLFQPPQFLWQLLLTSCLLFSTQMAQAQTTWEGDDGVAPTDWGVAENWDTGAVPTDLDNVIIPSTTNQPTIMSNITAEAKSVTINAGATLTIQSMGMLTIDGAPDDGILNNGTVENTGKIVIGLMTKVGNHFLDHGIENKNIFNNNMGGEIQIEETHGDGIRNAAGIFTNHGIITIGSNKNPGGDGIDNNATFDNHGDISIDGTGDGGIDNSATFDNHGDISIDGTEGDGIENDATFDNHGDISIDGTEGDGIENEDSFTNFATITIGATTQVNGDGIENESIFNNELNGEIRIEATTVNGIRNGSNDGVFFHNDGLITIGIMGTIGRDGINQEATLFENSATGEIQIEGVQMCGIFLNEQRGQMTNSGKITIGAQKPIGGRGMDLNVSFTNHAGGAIHIDDTGEDGIAINGGTSGSLTNNGDITIGLNKKIGTNGIFVEDNGTLNHESGTISIDDTNEHGIFNEDGVVTNKAKIEIGLNKKVGVNSSFHGIYNQEMIMNNSGGEIQIEETGGNGILNLPGDIFTNAAKITMGSNKAIGVNGIDTRGTFNNNIGGEILINQRGRRGIYVFSVGSTFTNAAKITVNANPIIAENGIEVRTNANFNNLNCAEIYLFDNLRNIGNFTNGGLLSLNTDQAHILGTSATFTTTNNGIIEDVQGTFPTMGVSFVNNEVLVAPTTANGCTFIQPAFNLAMNPLFNYLGVFSDAGGMNQIGTIDKTNNSVTFNPALAEGMHDLFVEIQDPNGGCTRIVSWKLTTQNCCVAPMIQTHPVSASKCPDDDVTFSVTATGTNLLYQWQKDGNDLNGETNVDLTLTNISAANAGTYTCIVSNGCGMETSMAAMLTVLQNVQITQHPNSVTKCVGETVSFSVTATGSNLTYKWKKNGQNIPNPNSPTLTLTNLTAADAGTYRCRVIGTCNAKNSNNAVLTILQPVNILQDPSDATKCVGEMVTFGVMATGDNLMYQWQKNGQDIPNATNADLTLTNLNAGDAGDYACLVTNDCGTESSMEATLTILQNVSIGQDPSDATKCPGEDVTFSVMAMGSNLMYQWQKNGQNIPGATSEDLTLMNVTMADAGDYVCVVNNACGMQTSMAATLTVLKEVIITQNPSDATKCPGEDVTFSVAAMGSNLNYQWQKNGQDIPGATNATLTLMNVTMADAGMYLCKVRNVCGMKTSMAATLTVLEVVNIIQNPSESTKCPGDDVTFMVMATGSNLMYQWKKNGQNLPGETNASLMLTNLSAADAGNYTCKVSNECGMQTSAAATLTILEMVAITQHPTGTLFCLGDNFMMQVAATGSNLNYQWQKDGNDLNGENNPTLQLTNLQATDAGSYTCKVSNECGMQTSNAAILTEDNIKPNFNGTCASYPMPFGTDIDECFATINFTVPTPTDNCSIAELKAKIWDGNGNVFQNWTTNPNGQFPPDNYQIRWRAKDPSGNKKTCTKNFTVIDDEAPDAQCHPTVILQLVNGQATLTVADVDAGSDDNCGIVNYALSQVIFDCDNRGTQTATLTVTDAAGLSDVCQTQVTVNGTSVEIGDLSKLEGTANAGFNFYLFPVTRADNDCTFTVDYSTQDGTATVANNDYQHTNGAMYFPAGGSFTQYAIVRVVRDSDFESDEHFFVNLTSASAGVNIPNGQAEGEILNDDIAPLMGDPNHPEIIVPQNLTFVQERQLAGDVVLFPNPIGQGQFLNVAAPPAWFVEKSVEVVLYDRWAREIGSFELNTHTSGIEVSALPEGLYFLMFRLEGGQVLTKSFMKGSVEEGFQR